MTKAGRFIKEAGYHDGALTVTDQGKLRLAVAGEEIMGFAQHVRCQNCGVSFASHLADQKCPFASTNFTLQPLKHGSYE